MNNDGNDNFTVTATGGSTGAFKSVILCEVYQDKDGQRFVQFGTALADLMDDQGIVAL